MNLDWLPGLDLTTGTFTLPLWAVAVAAAVIVALVVIAVVRSGLTEFGGLVFRVAVIVIAVVFGWTYVSRTGERDRADERRALDHRAAELVGRALRRARPLPASRRPTPKPSRAPASAPCSQAPKRSRLRPPICRRGSRCSPTRTNTPRGAIRLRTLDRGAAPHHRGGSLRPCLAGAGDARRLHGRCVRCVRPRL